MTLAGLPQVGLVIKFPGGITHTYWWDYNRKYLYGNLRNWIAQQKLLDTKTDGSKLMCIVRVK